jgi:hypothetical protein
MDRDEEEGFFDAVEEQPGVSDGRCSEYTGELDY